MKNDLLPDPKPTVAAFDDKGNHVDALAVENEEISDIDFTMRAVEVAVACAIRDVKQLVDALGAMVRAPVPGSTQTMHHVTLTSDHADSTVKLMRTIARDALNDSMGVPEADMRLLAARAMLHSFHAGLMTVNIEVDSAPGIALAKLFVPCAHVVLSARRGAAEKHNALTLWSENRKRILSKVVCPSR